MYIYCKEGIFKFMILLVLLNGYPAEIQILLSWNNKLPFQLQTILNGYFSEHFEYENQNLNGYSFCIIRLFVLRILGPRL